MESNIGGRKVWSSSRKLANPDRMKMPGGGVELRREQGETYEQKRVAGPNPTSSYQQPVSRLYGV